MMPLHVTFSTQAITFNLTTKHDAIFVCIVFCCIFFVFYIFFNFRLTPRMAGLHQPLNGAQTVMTMLPLNSWLRPLYIIKVILLFK